MLTTMYGLLLATGSAIAPTWTTLSWRAPLLFRTASSRWRLSLNTMRLTPRSGRTSAVRANGAVLPAMSSRTPPINPQARTPPLRKNLDMPIATPSPAVEVHCYPGLQIRCDRLEIGGARANCARQHIRRIVQRPDARQRIDHRS